MLLDRKTLNEIINLQKAITEPLESVYGCVTGNTLVAVADEREVVSIETLANNKQSVHVYCLDENFELTVSLMLSPNLTRVNTPIYRIMFTNGKYIDVTEDHLFLVHNMGYLNVKRLELHDSFFSMEMVASTSSDPLAYTVDVSCYGVPLNKNHKQDFSLLVDDACTLEDDKILYHKICEVSGEPFDTYVQTQWAKPGNITKGIINQQIIDREFFGYYKEQENSFDFRFESAQFIGYADVYSGFVKKYHNFFVGGWSFNNSLGFINNRHCVST